MSPGYGGGLYGTELYGSALPVCNVRELPPLRTHIEAVTPSGRHYRWGEDETDPINVPSGLRHSSTMPGGYESMDCVLPRRPGIDYSDLERLTTLRIWGAGGDLAGEYRLERSPRVSGDDMSVSPSAVGYQALLEDDKSARVCYVDRGTENWYESRNARAAANAAVPRDMGQFSVTIEPGVLRWDIPNQDIPAAAIAEVFYRVATGARLASMAYVGSVSGTTTGLEAPALRGITNSTDTTFDAGTALTLDNTLRTATLAAPQYGLTMRVLTTSAITPVVGTQRLFTQIAVYGDHGLPLTEGADGGPSGVLASDVIMHAVDEWASGLTYTAGETVIASTFVIPHLVFSDLTTAGEIIRQASRFGLQDWAVWGGPTFWWHPRGTFGRNWRARIGPAQLEETGPQVDRLWNSVMVQYQDVDGTMRTVGPVGSGADTEDSTLEDSDPDNPATLLGITRREKLAMGVGTAASATEVGRRFLEESKVLDRSGRARLVGHVMDDRGVLHPYWRVRAGDTISFVDAADSSARRIVRADHDRASRTCSVDLDAPPEGLTALLERLSVVLVPLGL